MVKKERCAFLRNDGFCLMHKAPCCCSAFGGTCPDGVRRAHPSKDAYCWFKRQYDRHTAKGRMEFNTRNVCQGIVYSQCKGKKRYATEKRAYEVLRLRQRSGSCTLRVYKCSFCGGYHLTHTIRHEHVVKVAC